MLISIRRHLSVTVLAVLLLGMGSAAALAWITVERLFVANLSENLLAQASLTAIALQGEALPSGSLAEPYTQATNITPGIHTRLLGEQGGVFVSLPLGTDTPPVLVPPAENALAVPPHELRQRPEIQSALEGVPATAVRRVPTADNRRVLYAAVPFYSGIGSNEGGALEVGASEAGSVAGIVYLATPLPQTRLPVQVIVQLGGAVAFAALLAGGVGIWLSRRLARPLEDLVGAAGAVAGGDLAQHVPVDARIRELHNLGQVFNSMTASLHRADQVKTAFIADVTHELRTPLTVIKGTVETLEDGALDDAEGREPLLASMHRETDRLIRLVNDLLVLARADAGALNLQIGWVDLEALARSRCERLSVLAAPRRIELKVAAKGWGNACGDADRLAQVLDNLLDNAIHHAPEGSTVTVTIQEQGDAMRCAVRDQGPGIPAEHLPFIFERFYRADNSRNRQTGGSGLGLAIVHSLMAAQGGGVMAESEAGQGATITFWLPVTENCPKTA